MTQRNVLVAAALVLATVTATVAASRSDEKIGAGVTLETATPIKALYDKPQDFVGKTVRIDGVVTAVCTEMGCWMAMAEEAASKQTIRFKVDHGAGFTFPLKAKGMKASAQGVLEKIADPEGHEAASEDKTATEFGKMYQLKATGAVLR